MHRDQARVAKRSTVAGKPYGRFPSVIERLISMKTWIALFRGINMVGRHLLPMKELVALLEGLGARDVKTYHQSGNVVLQHRGTDAAKLAGRISAAIGKE
jgi:hypothetical protein